MAAGGCGERRTPRGLRCLTIARWIVATVVAALAATVLLLVLTVGLRSESMSISVNHGHFQVAKDLWSVHEYNLSHYLYSPDTNESLPEFDRNDTLAVYEAADHVDIWVSMNFQIPGCNGTDRRRPDGGVVLDSMVTAVSVFDMPNAPSFLGMVRIVELRQMQREICHFYPGVLDRWIPITDNRTLDYIAKTYGGRSEFTVMVQVDTTTTTNTTRGHMETTNNTHYCWPVTIGHSRSITAEAITCKPSRGIDYTAGSGILAPPPPPPPANSPPPPKICELCAQN